MTHPLRSLLLLVSLVIATGCHATARPAGTSSLHAPEGHGAPSMVGARIVEHEPVRSSSTAIERTPIIAHDRVPTWEQPHHRVRDVRECWRCQ